MRSRPWVMATPSLALTVFAKTGPIVTGPMTCVNSDARYVSLQSNENLLPPGACG
jgi:hypothetical protein